MATGEPATEGKPPEEPQPKQFETSTFSDVSEASTPVSPRQAELSLYEEHEWNALSLEAKKEAVAAISSVFLEIQSEIESRGDGASEESILLGTYKNYFKLSLIILTSMVAPINLVGASVTTYTQLLSIIAGLLAVIVSAIGTIDSFFAYNEKSLSLIELHYRCRDVFVNLKARWAIGVREEPDYKSYRNAYRILDAAQMEFQQVNKLAKRITRDGSKQKESGTT